jgi:hypothetical protein
LHSLLVWASLLAWHSEGIRAEGGLLGGHFA